MAISLTLRLNWEAVPGVDDLFDTGLLEGRDVLESADRQAQIEFGQEGLQIVGQAFHAAVRQRVGIGPPESDGRRASANAMIASVAERTPESNMTGVEPAALTTPGSNCSVETAEFAWRPP